MLNARQPQAPNAILYLIILPAAFTFKIRNAARKIKTPPSFLTEAFNLSGNIYFYLLCGIMDVLASSLRGLGYSILPMVVSLIGVCALRLVWIATIFQLNRTPFMLYISYPISWALTALVHLTCLLVVRRKLRQKQQTI